jgi:Fe2+ transport system protein FeoA
MKTIHTLSSMKVGETATVQALHVDTGFQYRLNGMGLRIGKTFEIIRRAPFNGPFHLRIGNTELMLRKQDAQMIEVLM